MESLQTLRDLLPVLREAVVQTMLESDDPHRKVAAVVFSLSGSILSRAANSLPPGVGILAERVDFRPEKYYWIEHAERKAIYQMARSGVACAGQGLYVPWFPCTDCARAIVCAGLSLLVAHRPDFEDSRWGQGFVRSEIILREGGVKIVYIEDLDCSGGCA